MKGVLNRIGREEINEQIFKNIQLMNRIERKKENERENKEKKLYEYGRENSSRVLYLL